MNPTSESFQFSSKDLSAAVEALKPLLDGYQSNLDGISKDIKSLEKLLKASPLKQAFRYQAAYAFIDEPGIAEVDEPYSHIQMTGTVEKEFIVFGEYQKSGLRLYYQRIRQEGLTLENGGR